MSDLRDLFAQPPNTYRPQPFWFLNHELAEDELRRQITEMHDKGLGGVVLHSRHGLLTPYMSAQWLDAIGVCIDELKRHEMEAWLYDENNWPSGTHGGELSRAHPEYRMRYLRVQNLRVNGGVTYQVRLPDYGGGIVCVQALRITPESAESPDILEFVGETRDLTDCFADGRFRWEAPPGHWFVAVFWEFPVPDKVTFFDGSYLDTMNDEAVRAFRSLAYEPHERFKDDFGATVKGVFTDEPGLMIHDGFISPAPMYATVQDPDRKLPGVMLAWTRNMLDDFRTLLGYELKPKLMHLLWDLGDETQKVRNDYFRALTTWYAAHYHCQLGDWCRQRELEYIGHTLEDPLSRQVRTQGDQLTVLAQLDRPGFDYLGHGVNAGRILAAKCASSAAHIDGKQRVMCEAFGGSGHHTTLADQRADLNFICAMGCNMLIPHAFYYSFAGHRKSDWPPTEFYHNGYWEWYRSFADYAARLCLIQATGHHVCDALVVLPTETVQVDSWQQAEFQQQTPCERILSLLSDELLRIHCDYDYVSTNHLEVALIKGDALTFPTSQEQYPLLIVPGCRVTSLAATRKIAAFYEAGGKVLFFGELPAQALQRNEDTALREVISGIFGAAPEADMFEPMPDGETSDPEWQDELQVSNDAGGKAVWYAEAAPTREWLAQTVRGLISPDITIEAEEQAGHADIICTHRHAGSLELYVLVNRGERRQEATITVPLTGALEEWDLEAAEMQPAEAVSGDGTTSWPLEIEPGEARLFVLDTQRATETITVEGTVAPQVVAEIDLGPRWRFEARGGNVAILDRFQFIAHDLTAGERHNLRDTPGRANSYVTSFEVDGQLGNVQLVLDELHQSLPAHVGFLSGRRDLEIYVNGRQAPPLVPSQWQDRYFTAADISDLIQPGTNELQICVFSLLEPFQALAFPAYLVGDFADSSGRLVPRARHVDGYFSAQGYPHFPGIGVHTKRVEVLQEHLDGKQRLILDVGQVRDCARTLVNGAEVAVRLWEPYEVDITDCLQPGKNDIVVEVAGTLANLYAKANRPAGLPGPARIWVIG